VNPANVARPGDRPHTQVVRAAYRHTGAGGWMSAVQSPHSCRELPFGTEVQKNSLSYGDPQALVVGQRSDPHSVSYAFDRFVETSPDLGADRPFMRFGRRGARPTR